VVIAVSRTIEESPALRVASRHVEA